MQIWIWGASLLVLMLVSAGLMSLLRWLWPDAGVQRLSTTGDSGLGSGPAQRDWIGQLPSWLRSALERISRWSLPAAPQPAGSDLPQPKDGSDIPLRLMRAGWRSPHALWLFGASKSLLTLIGLACGTLLARWLGYPMLSLSWWMLVLGLTTCAYALPELWLRWCTAQRREQLFRAFPDALDMLRICVQAGLGLDAAIERVGREMQLSSPVLSQEWRLTGLELRAGASRRIALQHLAQRVGLREIDAMVTMLVQADRFGTRMSDALQVYAETLRTQRKQRAEAAAAQLPVKLLFPLIFCIFPALLTVMLGPVVISLIEHFAGKG